MKRYLLFGHDRYYPHGGVGDMYGDMGYESIEDAMKAVNAAKGENSHDYWEILDTKTGELYTPDYVDGQISKDVWILPATEIENG